MSERVHVVVKCPDCVETRLVPGDVTLRRCIDDESWSYRFTCKVCQRPAVSTTGAQAAHDAIAAGCPLESWSFPAERREQLDGPVLTLTDLLELHELLEQPDWFDELTRVGRAGE